VVHFRYATINNYQIFDDEKNERFDGGEEWTDDNFNHNLLSLLQGSVSLSFETICIWLGYYCKYSSNDDVCTSYAKSWMFCNHNIDSYHIDGRRLTSFIHTYFLPIISKDPLEDHQDRILMIHPTWVQANSFPLLPQTLTCHNSPPWIVNIKKQNIYMRVYRIAFHRINVLFLRHFDVPRVSTNLCATHFIIPQWLRGLTTA